eukprot:6663035-Alexandrium_andersonii.AAC.1
MPSPGLVADGELVPRDAPAPGWRRVRSEALPKAKKVRRCAGPTNDNGATSPATAGTPPPGC